jgi:quercetin dioxygenase-like cupin family protein
MTGQYDSRADEQEALWRLGGVRLITIQGEQVGGALRVREFRAPARTRVVAWRRQDVALYVLAGQATVVSGRRAVTIRPGAFLFLPSQTRYYLEVSPLSLLHYLTWVTPAGFAHSVTRLGDPRHALLLEPPPAPDRDMISRFADLLRAGEFRETSSAP